MVDSVGSATTSQTLALQAVKQEADSAKQIAEVIEDAANAGQPEEAESSSPEPHRGQNVDTYA
jgi:hypothetical protein